MILKLLNEKLIASMNPDTYENTLARYLENVYLELKEIHW